MPVISTHEGIFKLPIMVRETATGFMAMFPKNRLHIQGYGKTQKEAVHTLQLRLIDVLLGDLNIL